MKLLTKESDYAIRAVMNLARHGNGFVSSRQIAQEEQIPLQFLRRILVTLTKHGIVESKEGIAGGARLRVSPDTVRLADLIRIFQGRIQLSECMFRKRLCANRRTCVLRKRIANIERLVATEFEKITIGDLIKDLEEVS